jgi:hypothetical protein
MYYYGNYRRKIEGWEGSIVFLSTSFTVSRPERPFHPTVHVRIFFQSAVSSRGGAPELVTVRPCACFRVATPLGEMGKSDGKVEHKVWRGKLDSFDSRFERKLTLTATAG